MAILVTMIFWTSAFVVLYSYTLYPLLLLFFRRGRPNPAALATEDFPAITVVITAHNEEKGIKDKLENTLGLDYPPHLLNVIVASDASTDSTDRIVQSYGRRNVVLVRADRRRGKEYAQFCAIRLATTPVLVFTDVATHLSRSCLGYLVEQFTDPTIGAVSSRDKLVPLDGRIRGEGAYVRYEMWLRSIESRAAGLVGLSGSCFAARREVCQRWRIDTPSDITVALLCAQLGLRAVSDDRVRGTYHNIKDESREFHRKRRTIIRGITAVWRLRDILNPFRYGLFALQVWSHKIFRWLVPLGMVLLLLASAVLARSSRFYGVALVAQCVGYFMAALGSVSGRFREFAPTRFALYFVSVNLATAAAIWDFLRGVRITSWNPSPR